MSGTDGIVSARLHNQRITQPAERDPAAVVAWLGAVQAQDFAAAKWAIALRTRKALTDAEVQRAFSEGHILRTHVLRPTWHFVPAADIHWMLTLTAPRVHQALAYASRYYGIAPAMKTRAATIFERALRDGEHLTRPELAKALARSRISVNGINLALLTIHAELEGVICSGVPRGKEQTYALLALRAPQRKALLRDEALADLATRYFRSHGPATIRNFVWWSGLRVNDAKRAAEAAGTTSVSIGDHEYRTIGEDLTGRREAAIHLLPIFDEYLVAYRDHAAVPRPRTAGGMLPQAVIAAGQIAGSWKAQRRRDGVLVAAKLINPLSARQRRGLETAVGRFGEFLQLSAALTVS